MSYTEKPQTVNASESEDDDFGVISKAHISHIFESPLLARARGKYREKLSGREAMLWVLSLSAQARGGLLIAFSAAEAAMAWGWSTKAARCFISKLERAGVFERHPERAGASKSVFLVRPDRLDPENFLPRLEKPSKTKPRAQISRAVRSAVFERHRGKCTYCGTGLTMSPHLPNSFHVDHMKSLAAGGSNEEGNLVASCLRCNLKKNAADFSVPTGEDNHAR